MTTTNLKIRSTVTVGMQMVLASLVMIVDMKRWVVRIMGLLVINYVVVRIKLLEGELD